MKFIFLFFALLLIINPAQGQTRDKKPVEITSEMMYSAEREYNSWSLSGGFGPLFIYADQTDYSLFPDKKIYFGPSVALTKHLVPAFAFELQYLQGKMYGEKGRYAFDGDLQDLSFNAIAIINQMSSHPGPINDKWNYYVKIGVGATLFRSRLLNRTDGSFVQKSELYDDNNTEYEVKGYEKENPTKKATRQKELVMPLGLGVMYRINRNFDVGLESTMHFSSEDNLDNILSGATNDRYLYTSINVSYKIGKKNKRHLRWTHRGYDMNLFGRQKLDPRINELDNLEEDIARYAQNRPINKDSVIIEETLKIIYDEYDVRSIFFDSANTTTFSKEDQILMSEIALELLKHPEQHVVLYGYSDPSGDSQSNMELSKKRAELVKEFLISELAVKEEQITIIAKGDQEPLSPTQQLSPRGLQRVNRRVDMVIEK